MPDLLPVDALAPTTIGAAERGLTDRLAGALPEVAVEAFPDDPESYRLTHQVGAVLVGYVGADYGPSSALGLVVQERTLLFGVHVLARSLVGQDGATALLERARLALTGYQVPGFLRAEPRRERFVAVKERVWTYALTLAVPTLGVQLDDDERAPLAVRLRRLTLAGPSGDGDVARPAPTPTP